MNDCSNSKVIHLLLKGDQPSKGDSTADEYVTEFRNRNLIASTVPVLEFNFINIELLIQHIKILINESIHIGLVVTSPRVVDALQKAIGLLSKDEQNEIISRINPDLLFIVGNMTASKCETTLRLKCNNKSPGCGNSSNLAEYIKQFCYDYQKTAAGLISLLYPKGNLSDSLIENSLEHVDRLNLKSLVVYKTSTRNDIGNAITRAINELDIRDDSLTLNLIFFSPSGVKGFMKIDQERLINQLQQDMSIKSINILYSSIGKTTENALTLNKFAVFGVASNPSPVSLVDSIQKAFFERDKELIIQPLPPKI